MATGSGTPSSAVGQERRREDEDPRGIYAEHAVDGVQESRGEFGVKGQLRVCRARTVRCAAALHGCADVDHLEPERVRTARRPPRGV